MKRVRVVYPLLLLTLVALCVGCGPSTTVNDDKPSTPPAKDNDDSRKQIKENDTAKSGDLANVFFVLKGMNEKLKIYWDAWPNKVKKALLELKGVKSVEDEWTRDFGTDENLDVLLVAYETDKISVKQLIAKIAEHDFKAEITDEKRLTAKSSEPNDD